MKTKHTSRPKTTDLGLSLGDIVDSRGPQREEARPPNLLAIFLQVQRALQVRDNQNGTLKALLKEGGTVSLIVISRKSEQSNETQNNEVGAEKTG